MLGDEQGSTNVMMPVHVQASGALAPATFADASAVTRTSYTPYGQLRGTDNTATDRGWLGQVEDRVDGTSGTGLTYLNARYYDPTTMRFISPDPLMNPGDPKTLDPYRYADNNPVMATDASGLGACYGLKPEQEKQCMTQYNSGTSYEGEAGPGADTPAPSPVKPKETKAPPAVVTFELPGDQGEITFSEANLFDGTPATVGNIPGMFGELFRGEYSYILDMVESNPTKAEARYLYTYLLLVIARERAVSEGADPVFASAYVEKTMYDYVSNGGLDLIDDPIYLGVTRVHTERWNSTAAPAMKSAGRMTREESLKVIGNFVPTPSMGSLSQSALETILTGSIGLSGYEFPWDEVTDPLNKSNYPTLKPMLD